MESSIYEFSLQPNKPKLQKFLYITFEILSLIQMVILLVNIIVFFVVETVVWLLGVFSAMITFMLLRNCFYNFYDYSYVDGEVRISKLVNNKYRKKVVRFNCRNVVSIGKVNGETYNNHNRDNVTRKIYAKSRFSVTDKDIVVLFEQDSRLYLLIMANDETFTSLMIKSAGVKKLDKDYIAYLKEGGVQSNG